MSENLKNLPPRAVIFTPKTRKRLVLNDSNLEKPNSRTKSITKGNGTSTQLTPNINKRRLSIPSDSDESDIDDDLHFAVQNQIPDYAREQSNQTTTSSNVNFSTQNSSNTDQLEWDHSTTKTHNNLHGGNHLNSQYQGFSKQEVENSTKIKRDPIGRILTTRSSYDRDKGHDDSIILDKNNNNKSKASSNNNSNFSRGSRAYSSARVTRGNRASNALQKKSEAQQRYRIISVKGQEFKLDLQVIEPYKNFLIHAGYTGANSLTAVLIFTAAYLPDSATIPKEDYNYLMNNIFLYVVSTLEILVAQDYIIICLNGGCPKRNVPGISFMRKCYEMIDRRLRKSMKKLLIVHPTFYLKTVITICRPFLSSKISKKVKLCKKLENLEKYMVEVNEGNGFKWESKIPEVVKKYDETL